jgi:hypothetical protein
MFSTIYSRLAPGETGTIAALLEDRAPLVAGGMRLSPAGTISSRSLKSRWFILKRMDRR